MFPFSSPGALKLLLCVGSGKGPDHKSILYAVLLHFCQRAVSKAHVTKRSRGGNFTSYVKAPFPQDSNLKPLIQGEIILSIRQLPKFLQFLVAQSK